MANAPRPRSTDDTSAADENALRLRASGKSFGAIAKELGYDRAHHANEAFNRALRRKSPQERTSLREDELARLDAMADGVRARKLTPKDVARQLRAVDQLRALLLAD
jgi:hypothetical protein